MSNRPNREHGTATATSNAASNGPKIVIAVVAALVVVAGLAAIAISIASDDDAEIVTSEGVAVEDAVETAEVLVVGDPLEPLPDSGDDPAIGAVAPDLEGFSHTGEQVSIGFDGRPKMIAFLAHWCPHCRAELPEVEEWVDAGNVPEGVDVYYVGTAQDDGAANWPPSAWFANETVDVAVTPTLMDSPDLDAARSYGLPGYPFWVIVDDQNEVVFRISGELGTSTGMETDAALDMMASFALGEAQ